MAKTRFANGFFFFFFVHIKVLKDQTSGIFGCAITLLVNVFLLFFFLDCKKSRSKKNALKDLSNLNEKLFYKSIVS